MATICAVVLILPIIDTATLLCAPICAIHSRGGNGDLAADDDHCQDGVEPAELHEDDQRRGYHQLVGNRIEEGTESRGLLPAPCEIAVEPVGTGRDHEQQRRHEITDGAQSGCFRYVIRCDQQRDQDDPQPGQQDGNVQGHQCKAA